MSKDKRKKHEPIIPGGFRDLSDSDFYRLSEEILRNAREDSGLHVGGAPLITPKPEVSENLVEQYDFFRKNVYNPKRVFYPCCGFDVSPIRGFSDSEVILMDKEKGLREIMEQEGIKQFVLGDVLNYTPRDCFDLVIILNPSLSSKDLTRHLLPGGYALSNNWLNNASDLLEDPNFEGIGTIDRTESGLFLARGDFSRLEPNQFATYLYVFRKLQAAKDNQK